MVDAVQMQLVQMQWEAELVDVILDMQVERLFNFFSTCVSYRP